MAASALGNTPPEEFFVRAQSDPGIYHDDWIDFNKNGVMDPFENPSLPVDVRVEDLLSRMTLEEKTNQMATLYGYPRVVKDELPTERWHDEIWKQGIGNIDEHMNGNTGWNWRNPFPDPEHDLPYSLHTQAINEVQRWFIEETRLGIPVDFTNEGIRGVMHSKATSFPAQVGVASTWNKELVRQIGRVTGHEGRVLGYTNVYSPVLDLSRDPRWGRVVESYSEDPFLTSTLGVQQVLGIQEFGVASTLKHFAIYSIPKGGRDGHARTDPHASWRDVQTIHLIPFRDAIMQAGALGVMSSYNDYDGIPVQASKLFLQDILRDEYGFEGYVVSDSGAVRFQHQKHRTAPTYKDAIRQSVEAGLNVRTNFTKPQYFIKPLRELVRSGELSEEVIDDRVRDVLRVKFKLGLFDQPYADPELADKVVRSEEHMEIAMQAARESIILLKNENQTLPLDKGIQSILVTGPLAHDKNAWWSRYGAQKLDFVTPLEGIRKLLGDGVDIRYAKGVAAKDDNWPESDVIKYPPNETVKAGIQEALDMAEGVDVIVAVLGETDEMCRESASRISLELAGYQQEFLEALHATGKPVVLVLSTGRAHSLNWADRYIDSILQMWFPGEEGGHALAEILFGDYNPAGRLPVTVPKSVGQIQLNFPARPGSQAEDFGQVIGPLYPFGHGLSYTEFDYSGIRLSTDKIKAGDSITVSFELTNSGQRAGDEVVQLYLRDDYTSVVNFDMQLRGFDRVHLAPGESKTLEFEISPEHMELYDADGNWVVEPGRFTVMLGASSEDVRLHGTFVVTDENGWAPHEEPVANEWLDGR